MKIITASIALVLGCALASPAFAQASPGGFPRVVDALRASPGVLGKLRAEQIIAIGRRAARRGHVPCHPNVVKSLQNPRRGKDASRLPAIGNASHAGATRPTIGVSQPENGES